MDSNDVNRCSICIIPEGAEGITFDSSGVCQLCKEYKKKEPKGHDTLKNQIGKYINKNEKYNCVVPVSGGRDSAYALYYAKKNLNLKPIAVHSDNDFETSTARKNLNNITQSLDVPLVRISSKKNIMKKIVSEKFKMNAPFGPGLVVDQTCEACEYGFESASYNYARKHGIKVIIWGDSQEESTKSFYSIVKHKRPTKIQRVSSAEIINYIKYKYYFKKLKMEFGPNDSSGLHEIHLYDYIIWDREIIVKTIENEMGWTKPENSATSWRIDCHLVPLVNYLTKKAYGVSKIELGFSSMIRSGKMDRNDALRQVKEINNAINIDEYRKILRDINISYKCIDKVLK